ncbi:MAG TPA: PLDc N-terminal domain-containing protein [Ktedonobacterales bacterium]|nr:PLDc N-terminal domain-containing protein [Ktedonobacterales bacterium]
MGVHSNPNTAAPPGVALVLAVIFIAVDLWVAMRLINDLYKPERQVNGDKNVWAAIILFGSILGILAYTLFGRAE